MVRVADIVAWRTHRHYEIGYLLVAVLIQTGHRRNGDTTGYPGASIGNKVLGAVDLPGSIFKLGMCLGPSRVRSGSWFGEAEGPEVLTSGQWYQVPLFLER